MAVDLRKIKKLIELVEESGIAELEVRDGEESIRIARPTGGQAALVPATVPAALETAASAPTSTPDAPAGPQTPAAASFPLRSPIAGTFYRAAEPGAPPFVEVGQAVEPGDVLCIIESMKMMHEIRAAKDACIAQICVANGEPISTGDVLFKLS